MNNSVSSFPYTFNNLGRLGNDDTSQKMLFNSRLTNYNLTNYYGSSTTQDNYVSFAMSQPSLMMSGTVHGSGTNSAYVENESYLMLKKKEGRALEKTGLNSRIFVSVPYLGKGSCDPLLESQLQQGESINQNKSVNTITGDINTRTESYPLQNPEIQNTRYIVEESAMDGWVHGGINSRELFTSGGISNNRNVNLNFKYL